MSIAAEDVQEMQAEIERLKHELADLQMHYRQAVKHEKLLEDELAVMRRALELACVDVKDLVLARYAPSEDLDAREYIDSYIQQAREEA